MNDLIPKKNYHEMIQFVVDSSTKGVMKLRYHEWAAVIVISEMFGVSQDIVFRDISFEKDLRSQQLKAEKRQQHRIENEKRRLANLEKHHEQN